MSLLRVPRDVWVDRINHFLSLREIVRTHSAIAGKDTFENIIKGTCIDENVIIGGGQHVQIKWMEAHMLHTSSIVLKKGFLLERLSFLVPHLKQMSFRAGSILHEKHLELVTRQCASNLTGLNIRDCKMLVSDDLILSVVQCPQLTTLSINRAVNIDSATLAVVVKSCLHLKHFSFTHTDLEVVLDGLMNGPKLISLECEAASLTQDCLTKIAAFQPQLQALKFNSAATVDANIDFKDLLQTCDQLKCLHLTGLFHQIGDMLLGFDGLNLPNIEEVSVAQYRKLSDDGVIAMARACPNLRILDLALCLMLTNDAIIQVGRDCRCLTSLNATYCNKLTDAAFDSLNTATLTALDLSDTSMTGRFAVHIMGPGSVLHNLNVSNCSNLKAEFANSITNTCLEKLQLSRTHLSKRAWLTLSSKLAKIKHIEAASCPGLSDAAVVRIVRSAPVKYFGVFGCSVSDEVVAQYSCVRDTYPPSYAESEM